MIDRLVGGSERGRLLILILDVDGGGGGARGEGEAGQAAAGPVHTTGGGPVNLVTRVNLAMMRVRVTLHGGQCHL